MEASDPDDIQYEINSLRLGGLNMHILFGSQMIMAVLYIVIIFQKLKINYYFYSQSSFICIMNRYVIIIIN